MRIISASLLAISITGCAQFTQTAQQQDGEATLKTYQLEQRLLPACDAGAWQLNDLLWFDSSIPVDNSPEQQVFDKSGRKCLMKFN